MATPRVSPDGNRVVFIEPSGSLDIASVALDTAVPARLIATERNESMPGWAPNQALLTYVTDRSGAPEIWLRASDGVSRPIVTARDFPANTTQWLMSPALSPGADRVIYGRIGHAETAGSSTAHIWISSVSGGAPVPVTNDATSAEFPGAWSPDGAWLAYIRIQNGKADIMKVKTSGQATPILLKADINGTNAGVPTWSPTGEWIEYNDKGENLISPDGKTMRSLGNLHADGCAFSHDGRLLYCLRADKDNETLFSFDIASSAQKIMGHFDPEFRPRSNLNPAIRLSLAPDGKSIVYGTARSSVANLWLLEGFAPKDGWLNRIFPR
jgi:Tol biopolymer transport system component